MNKSILIIGRATCPRADSQGHGADESRANLLTNGKVYCIFCGTSEAPDQAHRTRALDGLVEHVCKVLAPLSDTAPVYNRSCPGGEHAEAHGIDFQHLITDTYRFAGRDVLKSAELRYFVSELPYAAEADVDYGVKLTDAEKAQLPGNVVDAINQLEKMGFCVRGQETGLHQDPIEGWYISLSRGTKVGTMGYVLGLNVRFKGTKLTAS